MKSPRYVFKDENGNDTYRYPLVAKMDIPNLVTFMSAEKSDTQRACERAFKFAVRLRSSHDLVEKFLAAGVWPLGRNTWKEFTYADVSLPLYCPQNPVPFPHFSIEKA